MTTEEKELQKSEYCWRGEENRGMEECADLGVVYEVGKKKTMG